MEWELALLRDAEFNVEHEGGIATVRVKRVWGRLKECRRMECSAGGFPFTPIARWK